MSPFRKLYSWLHPTTSNSPATSATIAGPEIPGAPFIHPSTRPGWFINTSFVPGTRGHHFFLAEDPDVKAKFQGVDAFSVHHPSPKISAAEFEEHFAWACRQKREQGEWKGLGEENYRRCARAMRKDWEETRKRQREISAIREWQKKRGERVAGK